MQSQIYIEPWDISLRGGDTRWDWALNVRMNVTDTSKHIHTYIHITWSKSHQSTSNQHVVFIMRSWDVDISIEAVGCHRNEDGDNKRFFSWSIIRPQTKYRWSYHLAKTKRSNNPAQKTCISCLIDLQKKVQCFKNCYLRKVKYKT